MASLFGLKTRKAPLAPPAPDGLPGWARALFASTLKPAVDEAGDVLVWAIEDDPSTAVISDQFTTGAQDYHQRYAAADHFERLFRRGLEVSGVRIPDAPLILDLGSGSGVNSIVPCRRIFPGARCVATDLSAELLAILAGYLRQRGAADEAVCVKMDAMSRHVAEASFDLVTGAAILHHLERPQEGLAAAHRALKPGGAAIFFEPFDGYGVIRLAYERILAEAGLRDDPLDPAVERALRNLILDITARTNPDPASPEFRALDDKWLFSRESIAAMAEAAGFAQTHVVAHNHGPEFYQKVVAVHLRLSGVTDAALPDWTMQILRSHDAALTQAFKRAAPLEATIVLRKPG
jgi:ubiquinone/menaquinone biosynthesis C-methylase UbiE